MSFDYSYVLPPTGTANNSEVREMFEDVKAYVNTLISGGGTGAPDNATYVVLTADAALSNERVLTGTSNQVNLTDNGAGSTIVLSLPQSIATTSAVEFSRVKVARGTAASPALYWDIAGDTAGIDYETSGTIRFTVGGTEAAAFFIAGARFSGYVDAEQFIVDAGLSSAVTIQQSNTGSAYTLTLPINDGASDETLTTDGSGVLSWTGRAKKDLSNLASTAVNVSIKPATPGAIDLGNTTLPWANVISEAVVIMQASPGVWFTSFIASSGQSGNVAYTLPDDNGTPNQVLTTDGSGVLSWGPGTGSGAATIALDNLASVAINTSLISDTTNTDDLGSSAITWKRLYLKTGLLIQESGAGTDNITIQAPSSIAASYTLTLPVDDGTPDQILTTNGAGVLSWVTSPVGSANTALSNLATVAINTSLLPAVDDTIHLGAYGKTWNSVYIGNQLHFVDPTNSAGNTVSFKAASGTDAITYTLPTDNGSSNQYLTTDGSGVLTWTNAAGTGTVNSGTSGYLAYYASSTNAVSETSALRLSGSALLIPATTNQIVLGTTRTVTFTAPTPASSSRTITFPDLSADYSVVGTEAAQTINGVKTFSGITVHSDDVKVAATKKMYLDGGGDSYLVESSANVIDTYTNNALAKRISAAGEITQPLQPSFLVTNSTGATDVTGDATAYTVAWPTEVYDQGSDFASDTFTAPVTGRYQLIASVTLSNILITHTRMYIKITTSNRSYFSDFDGTLARDFQTQELSVIADMDSGDTATVTVAVFGSTKTVDQFADATYNRFSGSLIN